MWKRPQKDKTEQNKTEFRSPAAAVSAETRSTPTAVAPKAADDLAAVKASVEREIAKIESLIEAERAAYRGRAERLEEEKARLSAHLELADNDLGRHLAAQNETIVSMRRKWGEDISKIESKISAEEKIWENRIKDIASELDNVKLSSRVEEENARAAGDSASLAIKSELRTLESRLAEIQLRRSGEGSSQSGEIRKREEDIAALKAQIALRAGQLKLEEERFERERADLDEKYRIRAKELDDKLASLRASSEKICAAKQDELLAFETAVKQRRMRFEQEAAARRGSLEDMRGTLISRIKEIESEIADDARKHENILKEREERLDKIKVELMLSDTAADAERQNRLKDLASLKDRAEKQFAALAGKYEQEKNDWDKKIADADRRMEAARLDAQIKMREMAASLDKARADTEKEKKVLSARLIELENEMLERNIEYEKAVSSKNADLDDLNNRLLTERERKAAEFAARLDELSSRKSAIEAALAAASLARDEAAGVYSEKIGRKNAEIEALRSAHAREITAAEKAMDLEKSRIKAALSPARERLAEALTRKENLEKEHTGRMFALEKKISAFEREAVERVRELSEEHAAATARLSGEIERLENELGEAVGEKSRLESEAADAHRAVEAEKDALDKELIELKVRAKSEIENLSSSVAAQKEKISADIEAAAKELAAVEAARARAVEDGKLAAAKAERELSAKTAELSERIQKERVSLDARLEELKGALEARRAEARELKISGEAGIVRARRELAESRAAIDASAVAAKEDYRARSAACAVEIENLKSVAADLTRRLSDRKAQTAAVSSDAAARVLRMSEALENLERKNEAEISRLRDEYERENRLISDEVAKIERDADALKADHAAAMARLREEIEKTEALRRQKISERAAAITRLEAEHGRLSERFASAVNSLKAELSAVEEHLPVAVAEKEKQVSDLTSRLASAEERHTASKEGYTSAHAQFVARAENRRETLRRRIEVIREKNAAEIAAVQDRLSATENEHILKENALKEAFEQKEKLYETAIAGLEKTKDDLEKTLREQTLRGRAELKELDKKIYELEAQLSHREKSNQEEIARIGETHENERKQLTDEIMMLRASLGDITSAGAAALRAKNEEITFTSARFASALSNLSAETLDKENQWKEANSRLDAAIAAIKVSIENHRAEWEKLKVSKERELADLGSKIANWEYDVGMERERISKEHETEKARLEKEIAASASAADQARRGSAAALAAKQEELKRMEDEYAARRASAEAAWRDTENDLLKTRERLQAELVIKESEYKERESAAAREAAALEKEIEDRKLKMALAVSEFESERIKTGRENKNVLKKLEREAAALLEKYTAYNEEAARSLADAEEKITVLAKRLATRDERMRNEITRRRSSAEDYIKSLATEIENVCERAVASGDADARMIESLREELGNIEKEHLKMSPSSDNDLSAARLSDATECMRSIEELEKNFDAERVRFAALLEAKMSKIDELEKYLDEASKDIIAESSRRRAFMDNLRKQGARLAYKLKFVAGEHYYDRRDSDDADVPEDSKNDTNK